MMYTIAEIERVAVRVFASVSDVDDPPSQLRMRKITDLYCTMLANRSASVDKDSLDDATALLVGYFLDPSRSSEATA